MIHKELMLNRYFIHENREDWLWMLKKIIY
jgi:hypothetical protein